MSFGRSCSAVAAILPLGMRGDFLPPHNGKKERNKLQAAVRRALSTKHNLTDHHFSQLTDDILSNRAYKDDVFEALAKKRPDLAEEKIRHIHKVQRTTADAGATNKASSKKGEPKAGNTPTRNTLSTLAAGRIPQGTGQRGEGGGTTRRSEERWHELEPQESFRMAYQTTGKVAPRLALEAPTSDAVGWPFVSTETALDLIARLDGAAHPIALVIPCPSEHPPINQKTRLDAAIQLYANNSTVQTKPVTNLTEIQVRSAKTKQQIGQRRSVVVINMQPANKILPAHSADFKGLPTEQRPASVPSLSFNRLPITELTVSVVKPMCAELRLTNWWTQLAAAPMKKLKAQLTNCIAKGKWQPDEPIILKNRSYKWRGGRHRGGTHHGNIQGSQ